METPPDADITITVGGSNTISNRLEDLRVIFADHPKKDDLLDGMKEDHKDYHNLVAAGPSPLLPPQFVTKVPKKWVHVKLEVDGSKEWVMFIVRPDNLYVIGFLNEQDGVTRAYEVNHKRTIIKDPSEGESSKGASVSPRLQAEYKATLLCNWKVNYHNLFSLEKVRGKSTKAENAERNEKLEKALLDVSMDEAFESYAVKLLSGFFWPLDQVYIKDSDDPEDMEFRRTFGGLIFKLCEPARMDLKLDGPVKIIDQIWSWANLSRALLVWRDKRYNNEHFRSFSELNITLPLHAIQFIINRNEKHFQAIAGKKSSHGAGGGSGSGEPKKDYGDYSRGPEDREEDREDDPQDDHVDLGAAQYEDVGHQHGIKLLSISANCDVRKEKGTEKEREKKGEKTESRKRKRSNYNEEAIAASLSSAAAEVDLGEGLLKRALVFDNSPWKSGASVVASSSPTLQDSSSDDTYMDKPSSPDDDRSSVWSLQVNATRSEKGDDEELSKDIMEGKHNLVRLQQ